MSMNHNVNEEKLQTLILENRHPSQRRHTYANAMLITKYILIIKTVKI